MWFSQEAYDMATPGLGFQNSSATTPGPDGYPPVPQQVNWSAPRHQKQKAFSFAMRPRHQNVAGAKRQRGVRYEINEEEEEDDHTVGDADEEEQHEPGARHSDRPPLSDTQYHGPPTSRPTEPFHCAPQPTEKPSWTNRFDEEEAEGESTDGVQKAAPVVLKPCNRGDQDCPQQENRHTTTTMNYFARDGFYNAPLSRAPNEVETESATTTQPQFRPLWPQFELGETQTQTANGGNSGGGCFAVYSNTAGVSWSTTQFAAEEED